VDITALLMVLVHTTVERQTDAMTVGIVQVDITALDIRVCMVELLITTGVEVIMIIAALAASISVKHHVQVDVQHIHHNALLQ